MKPLKETEFVAEVVWLGSTDAGPDDVRSTAMDQMDLGFDGLAGSRHAGENRPACVRVDNLYAEGTEIRNTRQLSILSQEEVDLIAAELELDSLDPQLLGASIILKGIPDFTHVPPGSRLQGTSGVTLTVDIENLPCNFPAREIERVEPGHGKGFRRAAEGRRGITAWVERPGALAIGDRVKLFVPGQRAWSES